MATIESVLERARARRRLPEPAERRRLREEAGLSQADVAAVVGVGRPEVTRYENGERSPRGEALVRYEKLLRRLRREVASC